MKKDLLENIPEANKDNIEMSLPNSPIIIHNGEYELKLGTKSIKVYGEIVFRWLPNLSVNFTGNLNEMDYHYLLLEFINPESKNALIYINGLKFGDGFITRLNSDGLKGTISDHAIMGDSSISVDKIKFSIPNLYEIHRGTLIKRTNLHTQPDRLILEDDIYIITIDKCSNYKERMEALDEYSGYYIQYNGEITIKKGVMTHTNIKELFSCLNTFLTFLNGKKTSSLFIHGIFEEKIIWTDFTPYMVDLHINVLSWANISEITDFNTLWIEFRTLWQNEENKDFLKSLIHWYVESNKQKYLRDGAIILGQTALELVYNWWIVENKQMIIGDDAKDLSAANKIRLIISQLQISSKVPKAFTKLQELMSKDAPEAIVGIRNSIVHSQAEKRSKLRSYDNIALYEALQVFIWYIELSLLNILKYEGKYFDRCFDSVWEGKSIRFVPWKNTFIPKIQS